MASELLSDAEDPLAGYSSLTLFPRTFRDFSRTAASKPIDHDDIDCIHAYLNSMALSSPLKYKEQAEAIVDNASRLPSSKVQSYEASEYMEVKNKDNVQQRRQGLGNKRLSFKPKLSQNPVSLLPSLETAKLQDPLEYFLAHEKLENAKKEIQRQTGTVLAGADQLRTSKIARQRRPGILRKYASYKHHYPSMPSNAENLLSSQESFAPDNLGPSISNLHQEKTGLINETQEREHFESEAKTDVPFKEELLDQLLSFNCEDLEGDGALNLLQQCLKIKPVGAGKVTLPDFHEFQKTDFAVLGGGLRKSRTALADIQNIEASKTKSYARCKKRGALESPLASISSLSKRLRPTMLTDSFACPNFEQSPTRNSLPTDGDFHQSDHVDTIKELTNDDNSKNLVEGAGISADERSIDERSLNGDPPPAEHPSLVVVKHDLPNYVVSSKKLRDSGMDKLLIGEFEKGSVSKAGYHEAGTNDSSHPLVESQVCNLSEPSIGILASGSHDDPKNDTNVNDIVASSNISCSKAIDELAGSGETRSMHGSRFQNVSRAGNSSPVVGNYSLSDYADTGKTFSASPTGVCNDSFHTDNFEGLSNDGNLKVLVDSSPDEHSSLSDVMHHLPDIVDMRENIRDSFKSKPLFGEVEKDVVGTAECHEAMADYSSHPLVKSPVHSFNRPNIVVLASGPHDDPNNDNRDHNVNDIVGDSNISCPEANFGFQTEEHIVLGEKDSLDGKVSPAVADNNSSELADFSKNLSASPKLKPLIFDDNDTVGKMDPRESMADHFCSPVLGSLADTSTSPFIDDPMNDLQRTDVNDLVNSSSLSNPETRDDVQADEHIVLAEKDSPDGKVSPVLADNNSSELADLSKNSSAFPKLKPLILEDNDTVAKMDPRELADHFCSPVIGSLADTSTSPFVDDPMNDLQRTDVNDNPEAHDDVQTDEHAGSREKGSPIRHYQLEKVGSKKAFGLESADNLNGQLNSITTEGSHEDNLPAETPADTCLQDSQEPSGISLDKQTKAKAPPRNVRKRKELSKRQSLAGFGTNIQEGVRRSTRIRSRPLEYWKGERFLYGRVHSSLATVIGVKYDSPAKDGGEPIRKVISYVPDEYRELVELQALH